MSSEARPAAGRSGRGRRGRVMRSPAAWVGGACLCVMPSVLSAAAPAAPDLHAYWDDRCKACHRDAGEFARSTLSVDAAGRLVGRHHGAQLAVFLRQHYLSDDMVEPVMAMLLAQAGTPAPVFKQKCSRCHESAAALARESLQMRQGVLVAKVDGRPLAQLLQRHGGLDPSEIAPMVETLERVWGEVGGGAGVEPQRGTNR